MSIGFNGCDMVVSLIEQHLMSDNDLNDLKLSQTVDNSKLDLFDTHHERLLTVEVIFRHLLYCRYVERKLVEVWVDHQYTKELGLDSSFSPCCTEFAGK